MSSSSWPARTVTDWNVFQSPVPNVNDNTVPESDTDTDDAPDTTTTPLPSPPTAVTATDTSPNGRTDNLTPYFALEPSCTDTDVRSNTNSPLSSSTTATDTSPDTL